MATISSALTWALIRNTSCFLVKQREGPAFSREHGNLTNLHSPRFSGVAQPRSVDIRPLKKAKHGAILTLKASKPIKRNKPAKWHRAVLLKRSIRNQSKAVRSNLKHYRRDLIPHALMRLAKISRSQRKQRRTRKGKKAAAGAVATTPATTSTAPATTSAEKK